MFQVILSLILTAIGAFFYQKQKAEKESLGNAEYDKSVALTEIKLDSLNKEQKALIATREVELARPLTKEELADVLKKI